MEDTYICTETQTDKQMDRQTPAFIIQISMSNYLEQKMNKTEDSLVQAAGLNYKYKFYPDGTVKKSDKS